MRCREILEPSAVACVECGTRIGQGIGTADAPITPEPVTTISANRNTLTYREDRNSRHFDASLTDDAMHGLGDVFGELFARAGARTNPSSRADKGEAVIELRKELPPAQEASGEQQSLPPAHHHEPKANPEKERLLKIFNQEGEVLELADNRLKAKSAADYYKRLTYLFLHAQEVLLGRTSTPRSELEIVLKAAKVYDANCRFWIKQKKGFTVADDDRMKLNASAREEAIKTINEALDANLPDNWNPDKKTTKPRATKNKKKA